MSKLNTDILDAGPASTIGTPKEQQRISIEDVLDLYQKYLIQNESHDVTHAFKNGHSKSANMSFKLPRFLKNISRLIFNSVKDTNKDDIQVLKAYFDSLNSHLSIIDSLNLNVAEKEILYNIIGYTINCSQNNTFKKTND